MKSKFPLYVIAGLAVVAGIIYFGMFTTKGARIELKGEILKTRLVPLGERATLMILDFRATNVSDYMFLVRDTGLTVIKPDGSEAETAIVSRSEMDRVFQVLQLAGPKYNEVLTIKDRIQPKQTVDRMVAARVELPESVVAARKGMRLRIEDSDGAVSELAEKK